MTERVIPYLLTCGPFVLTLAAWARLYREPRWPPPIPVLALGIVSANAALAAVTFIYYDLRPSPLPPWQNLQILTLGLLFLLAPIGMIVGFIAGARGAPKWLVCIVEIASVPLLVVGFFAVAAV